MKAPTCRRCGHPLAIPYCTHQVTAQEQRMELAQDGAGMVSVLAATSACSWNCLAVLAAQQAGPDADAAVLIVAERERQVTAEGYTPEHDTDHKPGELAQAGACYAMEHGPDEQVRAVPLDWPWDREWWKPKGIERDLVRAGALLAAEVDAHRRRQPATSSGPW